MLSRPAPYLPGRFRSRCVVWRSGFRFHRMCRLCRGSRRRSRLFGRTGAGRLRHHIAFDTQQFFIFEDDDDAAGLGLPPCSETCKRNPNDRCRKGSTTSGEPSAKRTCARVMPGLSLVNSISWVTPISLLDIDLMRRNHRRNIRQLAASDRGAQQEQNDFHVQNVQPFARATVATRAQCRSWKKLV